MSEVARHDYTRDDGALDPQLILPNAVCRWAEETPDEVFLEHVDGRRLTYAEADHTSRCWATALRRDGLGAGDHLAVMVDDPLVAALLWIAAARVGALAVPINTAHVGRMLHHVLDHSDSVRVFVSPELLDRVTALLDELPAIRRVIVSPSPVDDGEQGWAWPQVVGDAAYMSAAGPDPTSTIVCPDSLASLLYTSGTTGPSKGVPVTWESTFHFWGWVPDDTVLRGEGLYCSLPLFHNSGRGALQYVAARGGRFITRDKFSLHAFWDDVRTTGAVSAALVGPMTGLLYARAERPDDGDNPLRSLIVGPMIPEIERFEGRFGVRVATCYGMTEVPAPIYTTWDHGPWGTCGREQPGWPWIEVRLVDERGCIVPDGDVGELVVRSKVPSLLAPSYYKLPDATASAWRGGWFHTGDAMRRDAEGWYYFCDRMKDVIRRRGENISSFEVELAVAEHDEVVECAAIAVPSGFGDDEVAVFVVAVDVDRFDPARVVDYLDGRLPAYMIPRFIDVVDELPRNSTSLRVQKHKLRERGLGETAFDREPVTRRS